MALIQIQTVRDAQGNPSFHSPSDNAPLNSSQTAAGNYQSTGIGNQGGVHRITISNGIASSEFLQVERYNPREQASSLPANGNNALLLAGRTRGGQPLNSEADIKDDTFFTVNGVHFPATSAAKSGLLVKNADGSYSLPGSQHTPNAAMDATGAPQPQQAPQESPTAEFFDADTVIEVAGFNALTGSQTATEQVAAQALLPYLEGNTARAAQILSRRTGGEPSDSIQRMDQLFHKVYASASAYMTKNLGVPGDEVFTYLSENLPAAQRASLSYRIFLGDKSAFLDAREHYLKGMRREQYEQQQLKKR